MNGFNNSELNRIRKNWDKEREISERTDSDYQEHAEDRFLRDLLSLSEADQNLALESYSRKRREHLAERLARMKEAQ